MRKDIQVDSQANRMVRFSASHVAPLGNGVQRLRGTGFQGRFRRAIEAANAAPSFWGALHSTPSCVRFKRKRPCLNICPI